MNYILVSSTAAPSHGQKRVDFRGPTFIDYYAENNAVTLLKAQLEYMLMAVKSPLSTVHQQVVNLSTVYRQQMPAQRRFSQGARLELTPYNYTVQLPPLAVLEFFKQHGYKVVGTNSIGETCIWTLEKQTTTDQSTQTDAAI